MAKYQELITNRRTLQTDIKYWESKGYELVSHAICTNRNLSILFKQIDKDSVSKPTEDPDFDHIVLSALRYSLPRHSYMPDIVRNYILRHWVKLRNKHWAILRDIREYICDTVKWNEAYKGSESSMDKMDLEDWIKFYNKLLTLKDTYLDSNFQHLKEPIILESELQTKLKTTQENNI